ncbi:hypothetical protein F7725_000980 [Dissostichus mawsoni]|uniref:Disks large-associated protein 4 n=1 Tax=Dissostichus mawsoni TaxID=36200 RepID=A0A7J5ZFY5_DISMA|nr:hypothetical protein F7725_000980 [Dissostichus mawsoni]
MASRQNTETEPQEPQDAAPTENITTNGTNSQTVNATRQDKAMEQKPLEHSSAPSRISNSPPETLDPALDPSSLPPPDPSLETGNCSTPGEGAQPGTPACLRDGNWFMKLLQAEAGRMEGWCQQMEKETKDNTISEEVLGTVRSAVGSAQLLITKKFEQFRGLCNENLDENKQLPSSVPKKQTKPKLSAGKDRSVDSAVDKQRQEARKRLMAAKRARQYDRTRPRKAPTASKSTSPRPKPASESEPAQIIEEKPRLTSHIH